MIFLRMFKTFLSDFAQLQKCLDSCFNFKKINHLHYSDDAYSLDELSFETVISKISHNLKHSQKQINQVFE